MCKYNSGLGKDTSIISPKGMKASCRVCEVTLLSRPPTKTVAFCLVWSDILSSLGIGSVEEGQFPLSFLKSKFDITCVLNPSL